MRKIEVPAGSRELTAAGEIVEAAGAFVAGLERRSGLRLPIGKARRFLYRHAFELAYRFAPDGAFAGRIEGEVIAPMFSFHPR